MNACVLLLLCNEKQLSLNISNSTLKLEPLFKLYFLLVNFLLSLSFSPTQFHIQFVVHSNLNLSYVFTFYFIFYRSTSVRTDLIPLSLLTQYTRRLNPIKLMIPTDTIILEQRNKARKKKFQIKQRIENITIFLFQVYSIHDTISAEFFCNARHSNVIGIRISLLATMFNLNILFNNNWLFRHWRRDHGFVQILTVKIENYSKFAFCFFFCELFIWTKRRMSENEFARIWMNATP